MDWFTQNKWKELQIPRYAQWTPRAVAKESSDVPSAVLEGLYIGMLPVLARPFVVRSSIPNPLFVDQSIRETNLSGAAAHKDSSQGESNASPSTRVKEGIALQAWLNLALVALVKTRTKAMVEQLEGLQSDRKSR